MRKRIIAICMVFLMVWLMMPIQTWAKPDLNKAVIPISTYCLGDQMHAFVNLKPVCDPDTMKVEIQSGVYSEGETAPVPLTESDSIVRYLFLIDLSMSMKDYVSEIENFVAALMRAEKQEAVYSVASFGEQYKMVRKNLTDSKTVIDTVKNLAYDQYLTDPYTAMTSALTDLKANCPRVSGDVVNLVLISDGEPDLEQGDTAAEGEKEKKLDSKAAQKIGDTQDIIVHTLMFAGTGSHAVTSFSAGTGLSLKTDGRNAGNKIASFVDSLYRLTFSLSKAPSDNEVSVQLSYMPNGKKIFTGELQLESVPVLRGSLSNGGDSEQAPDDSGGGSWNGGNEISGSASSGSGISGNTGSGDNILGFPGYLWMILGAIVLIVIVLLIFVICRKKKKGAGHRRKKVNLDEAIYMRMEILAGDCVTSDRDFYLTDQIVIGSDSDCDLVLEEKDASGRHSRIFCKDQMIYIEDLHSTNGTMLEGMRLHAPNPLRSGNEITIGTARFTFRF